MLPQMRVGDSVNFQLNLQGHSGRTLSFALVGPQSISIAGTEVGTTGQFDFYVSSPTTSAYTAGTYFWSLVSILGTDRKTVETGQVQILPDINSVTTPFDVRSHAARMLDAIEATIEGRIVKDAESYMIRGRSLTRIPMPELIKLRDTYRAEVLRQDQAAGIVPARNKIRAVFVR